MQSRGRHCCSNTSQNTSSHIIVGKNQEAFWTKKLTPKASVFNEELNFQPLSTAFVLPNDQRCCYVIHLFDFR